MVAALTPVHPLAHPLVQVRGLRADEASNPLGRLDLVVVVEPAGDPSAAALSTWLRDRKQAVSSVLAQNGAVLCRGFQLDTAAFEAVMAASFDTGRYLWMLPMSPGAARRLLALPLFGALTRRFLGWIERVSTGRRLRREDVSTLANDDTLQFPHHEYGIFFNVPRVIGFWCESPSQADGETVLCDGEAAWTEVDPRVRARFEGARGIRYRDVNQPLMPPFAAPAVLRHPVTGAPTLNFTAYHHDVAADVAKAAFPGARVAAGETDDTFLFEPTMLEADGGRGSLSREEVAEIARAHFAHAVLLRWHENDLLLLDNFKLLHGRLNAGTPKKTLHIVLGDHAPNPVRFFP